MELFIEKVNQLFWLNSGTLQDKEVTIFVHAVLKGYIDCLYDYGKVTYGEYEKVMEKLRMLEDY